MLMMDKNKPKGKLHMNPIIEMSWPHKEYSASMGEDVSLVGESMGMLETTFGGLVK